MTANPSLTGLGWVARRSEALGEVLGFAGFALGRLASPGRLIVTLGVVAILAGTPWLVQRIGPLAWAAAALAAAVLLLMLLLLLISYLRVRARAQGEEAARRSAALAVDQAARDTRMRDSLIREVGALERRLAGEIDTRLEAARAQGAAQVQGALAMQSDRLEVLRQEVDGKVRAAAAFSADVARQVQTLGAGLGDQARDLHAAAGGLQALSADIEQRDGVLRSEIAALNARTASRDDVAAMIQDVQRLVEARQQAADQEIARFRGEIEGALSNRLAAMAEEPRALADAIHARLNAERELYDTALRTLREEVGTALESSGKQADGAFSYLRGLVDRRIQAGASALRGELEGLRGDVSSRLIEMQEALPTQSALVDDVEQLKGRVEDMSGLRREVAEALLNQEAALRTVDEGVSANHHEVLQLRASIADAMAREASDRSAAIEAAMAHETAARQTAIRDAVASAGPGLEERLTELRALLDQRMGPEFESRLEAWRARLDNEIGSALETGRTEDRLAAQEREARLRQELQSLHDAILRQREDAQDLHEAVARSMDSVRAEVSETLKAGGSSQAEIQALRDAVQRQGEDVQDIQDAVARSMEAVKKDLSDGLANAGASGPELQALRDALRRQQQDAEHLQQAVAQSVETIKSELAARNAVEPGPSADEVKSLRDIVRRYSEDSQDLQDAVTRSVDAVKKDVSAALAAADEARKVAAEASKAAPQGSGVAPEDIVRLEKGVKDAEARAAANSQALRRMSDSNAAIARPFDRLLAGDKIQKIEQHWLKAFGITMSRTALAYMAHKICLLEDRGMGRIAAPIETIIMRQLALRSLPNRGKLEVMEIGTLFGLGAAVLYNFRGARASGMHLTLIDPLEGQQESGGADPVTGVEVSEAVLRRNLAELHVPEDDYRLIKALSTDPKAIRPASDRLYDLILLDGDHSTAGVAADFETYGPLVKPGGLILFGDYGSEHWPGIQLYVDETVRTDPNWIWIGADYRTAVAAKKADGATARVAPPATERKAPARRPAKR